MLAAALPVMSALVHSPVEARLGAVSSGLEETSRQNGFAVCGTVWNDQIQARSKAGAALPERFVSARQNIPPQTFLDVRNGQMPRVAQVCSNLQPTHEMEAVSEQTDGQPDRPIQELPEKLPVLDFGQTLEAALTADDVKTGEGTSADFYHFQGKALQKMYLEVTAEFETIITISHPDGFESASTSGLMSVLYIYLPADGDYTIGITSVDPAAGLYTISLLETAPPSLLFAELLLPPPAPKKPSETPPAQEMQLSDVPRLEYDHPIHEILDSDAPCRSSSSYADCYRIEGKRGQKIALTLSSDAFDAMLELGGPDNFYKYNDDGPGEGADSMLAVTLPADGTYYVGVSSYKRRKKGAYVLTLREGSPSLAATEPPPPSASIPLPSAEEEPLVSGGSNTQTMAEHEAATESWFTGWAGQRLHIISRSDDTPARFELVAPGGHRWRSDFQIDRTDAREALVVTLPLSGEYQILHYGVDDRPGVAYKFSTEEAHETTPCQFEGNIKDRPPRRFANGGTLTLGADVCGNITPSDPVEAGRHADTYEMSLAAQTEIDVLLRGHNWNHPWTAEGEITGPQGFRRSLPLKESPPTLVVPATGVYKIKVFTSPDSTVPYGDYELLVRPGGGPWVTTTSP